MSNDEFGFLATRRYRFAILFSAVVLLQLIIVKSTVADLQQQQQQQQRSFRWPQVGGFYQPNTIRWWDFSSPPGFCVRISLSFLELETSNKCEEDSDYLDIYDGSCTTAPVNLERYCGLVTSPVRVTSSGHKVCVFFYSDTDSETGRGFEGSMITVPCERRHPQQQPLRQQQPASNNFDDHSQGAEQAIAASPVPEPAASIQYLASIQYPSPISGHLLYPPGQQFTWQYSAPIGSCLEFKITALSLESSYSCANDYVAVYDGPSGTSSELFRACGLNIPLAPVRTTSNAIFIFFNSDENSETGRGFSAVVGVVKNCHQQQQLIPSVMSHQTTAKPSETDELQGRAGQELGARESSTTPESPVLPPTTIYETFTMVADDDESDELACGSSAFEPAAFLSTGRRKRVVGGRAARPHSWPWQVSIRYLGIHWCGGSLVSKRHIITAAHCFREVSLDPEDFEFWVGKHRKNDRETESEQLLHGEAIILNHNYNADGEWDSDIAVVRLRRPGAEFNRFVRPICLPLPPTTELQVNTVCYTSGFGQTNHTGDDDVLKQAAVPIVDNNLCKQLDKEISDLVTENMICAGYGDHDSCKGDSGGPLMCQIGTQKNWVLSGVVSFGNGCGAKNTPAVYVRVTRFLPWLRRTVTDLPHY